LVLLMVLHLRLQAVRLRTVVRIVSTGISVE